MSKTIQLSSVHAEMLKEASKRNRIKPDELIEQLIQVEFNKKK